LNIKLIKIFTDFDGLCDQVMQNLTAMEMVAQEDDSRTAIRWQINKMKELREENLKQMGVIFK